MIILSYNLFVNSYKINDMMISVIVGIRVNVYNRLSHGIVGNSVCRTWESRTLAFPCAVNRVIHDSIARYVQLRFYNLEGQQNFKSLPLDYKTNFHLSIEYHVIEMMRG